MPLAVPITSPPTTPTSIDNRAPTHVVPEPVFGYPAIAFASGPHVIRHVQRGLRELPVGAHVCDAVVAPVETIPYVLTRAGWRYDAGRLEGRVIL